MLHASCHCGAVHLEIDGELADVTECNCSICRRTGMLCAYFSPTKVRVTPPAGATDIYTWNDQMVEFHRCKVCGCLTHWSPAEKTYDRMGVNARMMKPDLLAKARVRRFDGADTWTFLDE